MRDEEKERKETLESNICSFQGHVLVVHLCKQGLCTLAVIKRCTGTDGERRKKKEGKKKNKKKKKGEKRKKKKERRTYPLHYGNTSMEISRLFFGANQKLASMKSVSNDVQFWRR